MQEVLEGKRTPHKPASRAKFPRKNKPKPKVKKEGEADGGGDGPERPYTTPRKPRVRPTRVKRERDQDGYESDFVVDDDEASDTPARSGSDTASDSSSEDSDPSSSDTSSPGESDDEDEPMTLAQQLEQVRRAAEDKARRTVAAADRAERRAATAAAAAAAAAGKSPKAPGEVKEIKVKQEFEAPPKPSEAVLKRKWKEQQAYALVSSFV